jgi:hypothetical protein
MEGHLDNSYDGGSNTAESVMNPPRNCANAHSPLQRHRPPTTTRMQHYLARSLVLSVYSDPRSIPTPLLVMALTQLINGHGISPDLSLLTTCLPFSLVFSVLASEHPIALRTLRSQPSVTPTHVCKHIRRLSCWCSQTNHG